MKKTVVIFYSKGYCDQVAIALKEYYATKQQEVNAILIDEDDYSNFHYASFRRNLYKFSARNTPIFNKLLGFFQDRQYESRIRRSFKEENEGVDKIETQIDADANQAANKSSALSNLKLRMRQVDVILKRFMPEAIVCTTAQSLKRVLVARARLGYNKMKVFSAISDFYAHKGFILKGVDKYLVSNMAIKQALQAYRIQEEDVEVVGHPVRNGVEKVYDKQEVMNYLGIENKELPTLVVAGGRYGSSRIKTAIKDVIQFADRANIIVLSDNSQSVRTFVNQICSSLKITNNVYQIDSIDDIAKIYSIANCVICTPTAYMTFEVIARGIPCVLTSPIDYREKGNFEYLTNNGFALAGSDSERLIAGLTSIVNNDDDCKEFVDSIKGVFKLNDVKKYGDYILSQTEVNEDNKIVSIDDVVLPKRAEIIEDEIADKKTKKKGKK